ncbi:MAG: NHL repeat-containing protein, partial [Opitutaceae bacterium]
RYEFVAFWREKDIPSGALDRPFGIAVSADGDLYVTDARRRVVRLNAQGEFKGEWGGAGSQPDRFENAVGVAVGADGSVFVTDYDLDRIQKFTPDGKFVSAFGSSGSKPGEFNAPAGVAVDREGTIYVADFYNSRVAQFGPDGALRKIIGHPGRLGGGALHYPTDVQISSDGTLIVADAYNYQLQWFDPDGQPTRRVGRHLLWLWPRPASATKGFAVPTGIAVAGDFIHVADSGNHRVVMLTPRGEYVAELKIPDPMPAIHSPEKVAVSPDGRTVYATDYAANRIAVLRVVWGTARTRAVQRRRKPRRPARSKQTRGNQT